METGLLHDYFGNFFHTRLKILLCEVRLNPREVRLKQTLGNLENLEKPKFPFQVEGTFGDYI